MHSYGYNKFSAKSIVNEYLEEEKRLMKLQDKLLDELIDAKIANNISKASLVSLKLVSLVKDLERVRKLIYNGR